MGAFLGEAAEDFDAALVELADGIGQRRLGVCAVRVGECAWESEREAREGSKRVRLGKGGERVRTVSAQNTENASGGQPALPRQAYAVVHARLALSLRCYCTALEALESYTHEGWPSG